MDFGVVLASSVSELHLYSIHVLDHYYGVDGDGDDMQSTLWVLGFEGNMGSSSSNLITLIWDRRQ